MSHEPLPPGMMFRSFLTVASSFVLVWIAYAAILLGIGLNFYPRFAECFEAGHEALQQAIANNPEQLIPPSMFWTVLALTSLVCLAVGFYVVKTAPFSHFNHAIFVAALVFIYFLTIAIDMVAFPLALLVGAKWTINRIISKYNSEEENPNELLS